MGNNFIEMLNNNKMSLIISLPENNIDLAREAVNSGADAIKVHINVSHRASGNDFGSATENKDFLEQLVEEFDCPIGIVPGDENEKITEKEIKMLENIDIDYFSVYMDDCPTFLLNSTLEKTVAGNHTYKLEEISKLNQLGIQAFEASVIEGSEYGTPLNVRDLSKYASIADAIDIPVIVPTQRKITPDDIKKLYSTGVKAVMAGAVSIGKKNIGTNIKEFRNAIDKVVTEEF